MTRQGTDPSVQRLLDAAGQLPDCAAKDSLREQAAAAAEALGDLDSAWAARVAILSSSTSHAAPKFNGLFMCLAWCLAMSDRDPERFPASSVLWQYKWLVASAPKYASIPRQVLFRLLDDLEARFLRAGWGPRAGVDKRIHVHLSVGEIEPALALVERWLALPRDRGSDCKACETSSMVGVLLQADRLEAALKHAGPIIQGRLSCANVPHSTFGELLMPLLTLGRPAEASRLYEKGRRLVAEVDDGAATLASNYLLFACVRGVVDHVESMLRTHLPEARSLPSDLDRAVWFGQVGAGLESLARRGVETLVVRQQVGDHLPEPEAVGPMAQEFLEIAAHHAATLDARNQNRYNSDWLAEVREKCRSLAAPS